jgi:hypothetical protein
MNMNRRAFFSELFVKLSALPVIGFLITACTKPMGSTIQSSSGALGFSGCMEGSTTEYLNPGHYHTTVSLSTFEIEQAVPKAYLLLTGDHQHSVHLTSADFRNLSSGKMLQKMDEDGHFHLIALYC